MKTPNGSFSQKRNPHRLEPVDKPGVDLLEKEEVKTKRPSMWNIVFYNDDYTPMDFVEKAYPSASGDPICGGVEAPKVIEHKANIIGSRGRHARFSTLLGRVSEPFCR
jgi:ATP-dependent Clp protease adaptor protein ClpS